jgi:sec-independent protein translocase protein TatA
MIPNIGPMEVAVVVVIALLIFGPRKLPELGRSVGGGLREFKDSVTGNRDREDDQGAGALPERSVSASREQSGEADRAGEPPVTGDHLQSRR